MASAFAYVCAVLALASIIVLIKTTSPEQLAEFRRSLSLRDQPGDQTEELPSSDKTQNPMFREWRQTNAVNNLLKRLPNPNRIGGPHLLKKWPNLKRLQKLRGAVNKKKFSFNRLKQLYANVSVDPNRDMIVFAHVPKTGGRHFVEVMHKEYGLSRPPMWIKEAAVNLLSNPAMPLPNAGWAYVHRDSTVLRPLTELLWARQRRFRVVTLLRDPIERIVSEYFSYHLTQNLVHRDLRTPGCNYTTLLSYLLSDCSWDRQVRWLDSQGNQMTHTHADDEMVERVSAELKRERAVIAITECYDDSVNYMAVQLNWTSVGVDHPFRSDHERVHTVFSDANKHGRDGWDPQDPVLKQAAMAATVFDRKLYTQYTHLCNVYKRLDLSKHH